MPQGAVAVSSGSGSAGAAPPAAGSEPWLWTNAWGSGGATVWPFSDSAMHVSPAAAGWHQHWFVLQDHGLLANPDDVLFACVNLDPTAPPSAIAVRWYVAGTNGPGSWEHCAYWGAQAAAPAANCVYAGNLPPAGRWVRLTAPAGAAGLAGQLVQGVSFALCDGGGAWARAGRLCGAAASAAPASPAPMGDPSPAGSGSLGSGPCAQVSPLAWWQAEGNAGDLLNVNHGLFEGGPVYMPGVVGQAFSFNGTSADVNVGNHTLNVGPGGGFTVECWIYPVDLGNRPIIEWNSADGYTSYGVHLWTSQATPYGTGTGCLYANLIDTAGGDHRVCTPPYLVPAQQWSHVALTYDKASGIGRIYFNGTLAATASLGSSFTPKTWPNLYFGARVCGAGAGRWLGGIDEVSLYSTALSAEQIQAIYHALNAGKCFAPSGCYSTPANLVGWWRAEDNLADQEGQDNGASWQGAPGYVSGEVGLSFSMNGSGSDVRVPHSSTLDVGTANGFTVETWINPADSGNRPVIEWNEGYPNMVSYGVHFWTSQAANNYGGGPGCLYANIIDTGGGDTHRITSAGGLVPVSEWSHIALTYDKTSGYASIYLNGVAVGGWYFGSFTPQTGPGYDLYFGARPYGWSQGWWSGGIDEASVYTRSLALPEIQDIFSAGMSGKCIGSGALPVASFSPSTSTAQFAPTAIRPNSGGAGAALTTFNVELNSGATTALTVNYALSGTATYGTDYVFFQLPVGSVMIPSGSSSVQIQLSPINRAALGFDVVATLTLLPGAGYTVDPNNNTINIPIMDQFTSSNIKVVAKGLYALADVLCSTQENALIVSTEATVNFGLLGPNDTLTQWPSFNPGLDGELNMAIVTGNPNNGFQSGDMYYLYENKGQIGWVYKDGSRSQPSPQNGDFWSAVPIGLSQGFGDLYFDQTGLWGNNLLAVAGGGYGAYGQLFSINSAADVTFIAALPAGSGYSEGLLTLPNVYATYGPWAGKLITGDETNQAIYSVSVNGTVDPTWQIRVTGQKLLIIPSNLSSWNLYCMDTGSPPYYPGYVVEISGALFNGHSGDILAIQAPEFADQIRPAPPYALFIIHWNSSRSRFEALPLFPSDLVSMHLIPDGNFERGDFAPFFPPWPAVPWP